MSKLWFLLGFAGILLLFALVRSCDKPEPVVYDHNQELLDEIRDLKEQIGNRDTLIDQSHDTVVYRVTKVKEIVREYYTVHDTIEKLRICDSLAIEAEKLTKTCWKNDSLHIAQEMDMRGVITRQDTVIAGLSIDNRQLKKNLVKWKIGAAGLGVAVVALILAQ